MASASIWGWTQRSEKGDWISEAAPSSSQAASSVPFQGRLLPDGRLSDHSPFWDAAYNAVMVTDTSFMRNPHYHQSSDTIETLDLPFLQAVIDGLEAAIAGC